MAGLEGLEAREVAELVKGEMRAVVIDGADDVPAKEAETK